MKKNRLRGMRIEGAGEVAGTMGRSQVRWAARALDCPSIGLPEHWVQWGTINRGIFALVRSTR